MMKSWWNTNLGVNSAHRVGVPAAGPAAELDNRLEVFPEQEVRVQDAQALRDTFLALLRKRAKDPRLEQLDVLLVDLLLPCSASTG